jgi:hypothetical protein
MPLVEQIGVSKNKTFWFSSTICRATAVNSAIIFSSKSAKRADA